jgi:carbon-monoxide dehydrogenase large subunit
MLRSTRRGLETWQGRNASTPAGAPVLDPTAYEVFGVETAQLSLVHGDTALTPYSTGTWGSLCAGMAGGG